MSNQAWDNANLVWTNKCKGGSVGAYLGVPPGKDYATHIPVCGRCGTDWVLKRGENQNDYEPQRNVDALR